MNAYNKIPDILIRLMSMLLFNIEFSELFSVKVIKELSRVIDNISMFCIRSPSGYYKSEIFSKF
jgi:hypothetical protein